jgi:hypothetical protein
MPFLTDGPLAHPSQLSLGNWSTVLTPNSTLLAANQIAIQDYGAGHVRQSVVRLQSARITLTKSTHNIGGVKLFDFPRGDIVAFSASFNLGAISATSTAFTAGSVVWGSGTAVQAADAATLTTTNAANLIPGIAVTALASVTGFTLPVVATPNTAPAVAASNGLILPGTRISAPLYLNALSATSGATGALQSAYLNLASSGLTIIPAGITAIDVTGFYVITWMNGGDNI